jgi:3-oxoacyl-[acyl-carrier protein] reductase
MDLSNRVAIVTGSGRGIGKAIALKLAEVGATVVVNDIGEVEPVEAVADEIRALNRQSLALLADVSSSADVTRLVEETMAAFGRVDILVNNAGIWTEGAIESMSEQVWDETINVNLKSVYNCCRVVVPLMISVGGGRIINLSSTAGQRGEPLHSHYAATKGAIISFTKSLAAELAPKNILVNSVAPGWVNTDMSKEAYEEEGDKILSTIPLRRMATAEEIAGAILFLASDLATYITGEILNVNGGSVLCG